MRIDKYLANAGMGSRRDCTALIRKGSVCVNGQTVKDAAVHINLDSDTIFVDGKLVSYNRFVYLMLHKPKGTVCANQDNLHKTVFELVPHEYQHYELCTVGRLDIDTEGLLLLTNDGEFAHRLMSPRYHLPKTYFVQTALTIDKSSILLFEKGVDLDGYIAKPAKLEIISENTAHLIIGEGKFHQVKRMFLATGNRVEYLKRVAVGDIPLDEALPLGSMRELTQMELHQLKKAVGLE